MRFLAFFSLLLTLAWTTPAPVEAHGYRHGDLQIEHPWARATPPGVRVGAGYLSIRNNGPVDDRLLRAEAEVTAQVELHEHVNDNGVMRMRAVTDIPLPAWEVVHLEPGGLHIMFLGLDAPLVDGEKFNGTLYFEHAGAVPVVFHVEWDTTGGDGHHGHGH